MHPFPRRCARSFQLSPTFALCARFCRPWLQTNGVLPLKTLVVKTYRLFLWQRFAIVPGIATCGAQGMGQALWVCRAGSPLHVKITRNAPLDMLNTRPSPRAAQSAVAINFKKSFWLCGACPVILFSPAVFGIVVTLVGPSCGPLTALCRLNSASAKTPNCSRAA